MKKNIIILLLLLTTFTFKNCQLARDVSQTLTNLKRLQFQYHNTTDYKLSGIDVSRKRSISDFSVTDGLQLTNAFAKKKLPAEFNVNILAKNPNDGTAGTSRTSATITNLNWRLFIDDKPTVNGTISTPITVPGTGQEITIPLTIRMDLFEFFGDKGYEGIIKLALSLGGLNQDPTRIKIDVKPTVNTSVGPITYPGNITVVNHEWR